MFMRATIAAVLIVSGAAVAIASTFDAVDQTVSAPAFQVEEDPIPFAWRVIRDFFGPDVCPSIRAAIRLDDGVVKAFCVNAETFLVVREQRRDHALQCSRAKHI